MADIIRTFIHYGEAWYATNKLDYEDRIDDITFQLYNEIGFYSEFQMIWHVAQGEVYPRLSFFDDSWLVFPHIKDLFEVLPQYNDKNISPEKMCEILLSLGFEDETPTENPYKKED